MKTYRDYSKDKKERNKKIYKTEYTDLKNLNKSKVNIKNIKTLYNIFLHTEKNSNINKNVNDISEENSSLNNKINNEKNNDIYNNDYSNKFKKKSIYDSNCNSYSDFINNVNIYENNKIQTPKGKDEINFFNKVDFCNNDSKNSNMEYFYSDKNILKNDKLNHEKIEVVSNERNFNEIFDLKNIDDYKKFIYDNNENIIYSKDNGSIINELKLSVINEKKKENLFCNNNHLNEASTNETSCEKDYINSLNNEVSYKDIFNHRKLKSNTSENDIIINTNIDENFDIFNFHDKDNKKSSVNLYCIDKKNETIKEDINFIFEEKNEKINEINDIYDLSENFIFDGHKNEIFNSKKKNDIDDEKYLREINKNEFANKNEIKYENLFSYNNLEQFNCMSINKESNLNNDLINLKKNIECNTENYLINTIVNGEEKQEKEYTNHFDEFFFNKKNVSEVKEKENHTLINNSEEKNSISTDKLDIFICEHFYKSNFDFDSNINENLEKKEIIKKDNNLYLEKWYTKKDISCNNSYLINNIDINENDINLVNNSNNIHNNNINSINENSYIYDNNNKLCNYDDLLSEENDSKFYKKNLNINNLDNLNKDDNLDILEINTSLNNKNFKKSIYEENEEKNKKLSEISSHDNLFIYNSNKIDFKNINRNNSIIESGQKVENLKKVETTINNSYEMVVDNNKKVCQTNSNVNEGEFEKKNFFFDDIENMNTYDINVDNSKLEEKNKDIIELSDHFFLPEAHKINENVFISDKNYEEFFFEIDNDNNKVDKVNYFEKDNKKKNIFGEDINIFEEKNDKDIENKNFVYQNDEKNAFKVDISKTFNENNILNKNDSIRYLENEKKDEKDSKTEIAFIDYYIGGKDNHEIIVENENTSFFEIIEEIENVSKDIIGSNINEENIYENINNNLNECENNEIQKNLNDEQKSSFYKNNYIHKTVISNNANKNDSLVNKEIDNTYAYFDILSDCNKENIKNDDSFKNEEENKNVEVKKGLNDTMKIYEEISNNHIDTKLLNYSEIECRNKNKIFTPESSELFNEHTLKSFDTIYDILMTKNYFEIFSFFHQNDKFSYEDINIPNFQIYLKKVKNIMKSGFNEMYDYNDFIHKFIDEIFNMNINDFFFFNIYIDNMNKYINKKNILVNNISNTHHFISDFYKKHEKVLTLEIFYKNMSYSLYFLVFINLLIELWYSLIYDLKKENYDKLLSSLINYLNKKKLVYVLKKIYNYLYKIYEELNKSTMDEKQKKKIIKVIKKSKSFKLIKKNIYKINNCCFNLLMFFLPLSVPPFKKKFNIFDNLLNYFFKNINKIIFKYIKDNANESFNFNNNYNDSKIYEDNYIQREIYSKEEYKSESDHTEKGENVNESKGEKDIYDLDKKKTNIVVLKEEKNSVNNTKEEISENLNVFKYKTNIENIKEDTKYVDNLKEEKENDSINFENNFSKKKYFLYINNNIEKELNKCIKDIIDNVIKNCKKNICLLKVKNLEQLFLYCFENPPNEKYNDNLTTVVRDLKINEKIEIIEKQLESYIQKNIYFYHIFFKIIIPSVNSITNIFENLETLFTLYVNYKIKKKKKLFYFYDPWLYSYDAFLSFSQLDEIKLSDNHINIFYQKKKKKKKESKEEESKEKGENIYVNENKKNGLNSSKVINNAEDFKIYFKKIDENFISKNIFSNLTNFYSIKYIKQLLLFVKNKKKLKNVDKIKNNINNNKLKIYYSYILKLCYNENYIKINTRALKYLFFHIYFN
ncbi:conserved Plasmodium protein, unknown function [Plasmodium gallinaceum]|uniref:Uncharacterized protein n=1 Tax=Plasmodium gallinaceum TaxID=5849 RepID=A0A1J1H0B1_PLAGA|nr:conserved Plasmodium protein, unknown function [Plasmodium gallinaceum]CRG98185.1 conserved Plasmodium protein, unknown function [Plasmodium gallinaceum]